MAHTISHLEHLKQAVKLLQLKKATAEDVDIIYDACWLLTPTQVQKLIQNYTVADYEDPISNDILKSVASRANGSDHTDILLLDNVSLDDSPYEVPEPHPEIIASTYIPTYVSMFIYDICIYDTLTQTRFACIARSETSQTFNGTCCTHELRLAVFNSRSSPSRIVISAQKKQERMYNSIYKEKGKKSESVKVNEGYTKLYTKPVGGG